MELVEDIDVLNKRLIDYYGKTVEGNPIFRIVWSEDQFEKRLTHHTKDGFELLVPEVRELPKYKQWIKERYVLEQLVAVPEFQQDELGVKISYEPLYVYADKKLNYLPPKWEATQFLIDMVMAARGKRSLGPKYVDPEKDMSFEQREARIKKLEDELWGNETDVGDALAHKQAVVVPSNFEKEN